MSAIATLVTQRYSVRSADLSKDREQITGIWRRNLSLSGVTEQPHSNDARKFHWQFLDNPAGQGRCWLLYADGEAVGTSALSLRRVIADGRVVTAGVAGDLAVDKAHRSLQPALALQKAVIASAGPEIDFVYGLPNERAMPLMKRAGYSAAAEVHRFASVLRSAEYVRRHRRLRMLAPLASVADSVRALIRKRQVRIERIGTFCERFEELWDRCKPQSGVVTVRDRSFLEWRFTHCPLRQYETVVTSASKAGRLNGYAVFTIQDGLVHCADLFVSDYQRDVPPLLSMMATRGYEAGAAALSIPGVLPPPLLDVLIACGFRQRTGPAGGPSTGTTVRARTLLAYASRPDHSAHKGPWYFTPADEDND